MRKETKKLFHRAEEGREFGREHFGTTTIFIARTQSRERSVNDQPALLLQLTNIPRSYHQQHQLTHATLSITRIPQTSRTSYYSIRQMQSVSCWYWWKVIFNAATSTTTITYYLKIWMRPWPSNLLLKFRDYLCLCHSLLNIRTVASRGSPSSSRSKSYFLSLASFFKQLSLVARAATQSNWLPQLFPVFTSTPTSRLRWYLTSLPTIRTWRNLALPALTLTASWQSRISNCRCLTFRSHRKMV